MPGMDMDPGDNLWPDTLFDLVREHTRIQEELGECNKGVILAADQLIGEWPSVAAKKAAVDQVTAALRADAAGLQADMWVVKARIDMVTLFMNLGIPYHVSLDPTA